MDIAPNTHARTLVSLDDDDALDPRLVGSKASNLATLLRSGFPVPEGVVVTTEIDEISNDLPHQIRRRLGDRQLAVRSSATAEDLPDASYAGQYETYLNVEGDSDLADAIDSCRASLRAGRVTVYSDGAREGAMAVLIQPMIDASAAGVAFSANPVTGARDEVVINAIDGLGDRLVSGEVTPEQWVVTGANVDRSDGLLERAQIMEVASLVRRVEAEFKTPQDIEWVIEGETLWLLQARPITSLPQPPIEPIPIEVVVPPGYWEHDASHAPRPNYPIEAFIPPMLAEAVKSWANEFGYLFDGIEFRDIGGWTYQRLAPLGGKEGPNLPDWLMWVMVRTVPIVRRRLKMAREAVRTDKAGQCIDAWYESWLPELRTGIEKLREVDLSTLADDELAAHLEAARRLCTRGIEIHAMLHGALAIILYELATTCERLLDWDIANALETVRGTSYKSTEPARRLADLTRLAANSPEVLAAARLADSEVAAFLEETDPDFAEAFESYVAEYGQVALGQGVVEPTYAEMPSFLIATIANQVQTGFLPGAVDEANRVQREERIASARADLATRPPDELAEFDIALERGQMAYPVREDNEFFTMSAPMAQFRYAILELGHRLTQRDVIESRSDVMFLELDEAVEALTRTENLDDAVSLRKGQRVWAADNPGPPFYGKETLPPTDLSFLPSEARLPMESMLWSLESIMAVEASTRTQEAHSELLRGTPASAGTYTGRVRVVRDESEFSRIEAGDVLVCPITSPVWSVLFPSIGALVTDTGGILSHPAIIAREYRIPAVVATGNATSLLSDGELVTVDGSNGTVSLEVTP